MSVLFVCNTYYQLIVAIQLALTVYSNCTCDLWLSDHSKGSSDVARRLKKESLFREVRYLHTKDRWYRYSDLKRQSFLRYRVTKAFFGGISHKQLDEIKAGCSYDHILFFNIHDDIRRIVDSSSRKGGVPKLYRMEEGLATCSSKHSHRWSFSQRALDAIRERIGLVPVSRSIEGYYCFIPELCDDDFPFKPLRIPSIRDNREELSNVLARAFNFQSFTHTQPYIFFGSSLRTDGMPVGEERVVSELAKEFGPNNILLKQHPRDESDIYRRLGIHVMESSYIPWEVVQLCSDFSDRTLITCTSGAPLAVTAMLGDDMRVRYLAPDDQDSDEMENYKWAMSTTTPIINKLHDLGICMNVVIESLDAFVHEGGAKHG